MACPITDEEGNKYDLTNGHFSIDCACGFGEDISFGNHIQEGNDFERDYFLSNSTRMRDIPKHTFYMNDIIVNSYLDAYHRKSEGRNPLEIICKNCKKEISLTYESYQEIMEKLMN